MQLETGIGDRFELIFVKLLGVLGVSRWVLRLVLLPLFLVREIWRRLTAGTQKVSIIRRGRYTGGPIAVVALYQQDAPRSDILGLLLALRRRGVYVIAVNTGQLNDAGARLPTDCYVERSNYGRDFGSYQVGLRIAQDIAPNAARSLLLNDSVFYIAAGLDKFLNRLLFNSADICSATESKEVLSHQTSFCLSFSRECVQHPVFQRFWSRYVPTDLRPATVLLGEVALSRVLERTGLKKDTLANNDAIYKCVSERDVETRALEPMAPHFAEDPANWTTQGNVSHRAPHALLDLELPIIKLDLPHRAGKSDTELESLLGRLSPVDSQILSELWLMQSEKVGSATRLDRLGARCGLS